MMPFQKQKWDARGKSGMNSKRALEIASQERDLTGLSICAAVSLLTNTQLDDIKHLVKAGQSVYDQGVAEERVDVLMDSADMSDHVRAVIYFYLDMLTPELGMKQYFSNITHYRGSTLDDAIRLLYDDEKVA